MTDGRDDDRRDIRRLAVRVLAAIGQLLALVVLVLTAACAAAICSGENVACDPPDRTRAVLVLLAIVLWLVAAVTLWLVRRRLVWRRDDDATSWMLFASVLVPVAQLLAVMVPIWVVMG